MPRLDKPERDRAIGARICLARTLVGMSRPALAAKLGVGASSVVRYEKGTTRVAAAMLDDLAAALKQDAAWFVATDEQAIAEAACYRAPRGAVLLRQFERAVNVLSIGVDRGRSG